MTKRSAERVLEISYTTGSGPITLVRPVLGYRTLAEAGCVDGDTVDLVIEGVSSIGTPTGDWEMGTYTWGTGGILTRTTITGSSNGGAAVNWTNGTRWVKGRSSGTVDGGGSSGLSVTVTGTPAVGNTLTASVTAGYTASFQWTRNGVDISGATSSTYTLVSADGGATVSVRAASFAVAATGLPVPAAPFLANSVIVENDNYFGRSTAMTGVTNSRTESGAFWLQVTADTTAFRIVKTDASSRCVIQLDSSKKLRISASDGTNTFSFRTVSTFLPTDTLDSIVFWYDTNFAAGLKQAVILRNGALDMEIFSDTAAAFTPTQNLGQYFGATNAGASSTAMVLREYMSWPGVKIDWQNAANLAKVYSSGAAVDPGANGELVTGTAPLVYLSLRANAAASAFLTNRGTGGDFAQIAGPTIRADMPVNAFGDSLTFGTGSSVFPSKTWLYLLTRGLNTPRRRINNGVGGESLIAINGQSTIKSRFLAAVAGYVAQYPKTLWTLEGGYNNLGNPAADIIAAAQDCVNALLARDPAAKWIFIGIPNGHLVSEGTGTARFTTLTTVNDTLAAAYGTKFLDIRQWLLDNGMAAAGLTDTADDVTDRANGIVPRSLRMADGSVHWNDSGQLAVYTAIKQRVQTLGYD